MSVPSAAAVTALLSAAWGVAVRLGPGQRIDPWSVARWPVHGGPVDSVVVKWVRSGDPADPGARAHPDQLTTEAFALTFLAEVGVRAPRLVATDRTLLVMTDFGGSTALDELIRRDGYVEQSRLHLVEAARLLADRHRRTVSRVDEYYRRLGEQIPVDPGLDRRRFAGDGWHRVRTLGARLGCPPGRRAAAEALDARDRLDRPGPFLALSNGDSATNNVLVGPDGSMIIDYEVAGYRHCLSDLADFFLPGPRWVTVADATSNGFEQAYRAGLAGSVPEVLDDARFGTDLAAVALSHAFGRLGNFEKVDARPAGDVSRLERMHTMEAAADLADDRDAFPALSRWCRELARMLRRRWPETDVRTDQLEPFLPRR